jgi:quercetin dioxygenase-like cupin family protein
MSAPDIRRVITGHNAEGKAVILTDEVLDKRSRIGRTIWATDSSPADNSTYREVPVNGATVSGGTVFRVGALEPGHRSPMHRTVSIDYAIVLEGTVGLELDSGDTTHVSAGEVIVQRGTNHIWFNDTDEPCVIAWILIDAEPVKVGDQTLEATHIPAPPAD